MNLQLELIFEASEVRRRILDKEQVAEAFVVRMYLLDKVGAGHMNLLGMVLALIFLALV